MTVGLLVTAGVVGLLMVGLLTVAVTGLLPPVNAVLTGLVTDEMTVRTGW